MATDPPIEDRLDTLSCQTNYDISLQYPENYVWLHGITSRTYGESGRRLCFFLCSIAFQKLALEIALHCISNGPTLVRIHRSLLNFLPQAYFFQIPVKREKCWFSK